MFTTKNLHLNDLILDPQNPRFTTREDKSLSESEIIDYLVEYEELLDLANSINNYGGFTPGERIIVVEEDKQFIILEGNRRISSLKLLNNPTLLSLPNKNIPKITKECSEFINNIPVDIVNERKDADKALLNRHIDGIRLWSQFSKMRFYKKMVDEGRDINEISSLSPDSVLKIKRDLQRYSILTNILSNYELFDKNSTFIYNIVETALPTDLLLYRFFTYYTDSNGLNLQFSKDNELIYPKNIKKKNLLLNILVLIAKMYWDEEIINTRLLNTKADIYNFFNGNKINDKVPVVLNKSHESLLELLSEYNNTPDTDSNEDTEQVDQNFEQAKGQDSQQDTDQDSQQDTDQDSQQDTDQNSQQDTDQDSQQDTDQDSQQDTDQDSQQDTDQDSDRTKTPNGGRKRKNPDEYDFLLKAFPFKNKYRNNSRINATLRELDKLEYKTFKLSANFLIRSLLESYAYEYTKLFSNLHYTDEKKLKGLTINNFSAKELNDKFSQYIAKHIGEIENGYYSTTEARILSLFSKSNNFSITQKLNQFIHLPDFNPMASEILDSWENICGIVRSMDEVIYKFSGQD